MPRYPQFIDTALSQWEQSNALRSLRRAPEDLVDFTSNDYLGLAKNRPLREGKGATGSRLLSGNLAAHEELEAFAATFFQGPSALLFNSGYLANLGVLGTFPQRQDHILYDARSHASIKEGLRLSLARRHAFRHNDLNDLERLLQKSTGTVYVIAEGIYSMDGDEAPLSDMVTLTEKYGAHLILDEAHSTGILGPGGRGQAVAESLQDRIFLRIYTFGKAVGWHGALVVAEEPVKQYLINRCRPLIYTTALPPGDAVHIQAQLQRMESMEAERAQLRNLRSVLADSLPKQVGPGPSPIVPIVIPGNAAVREVAARAQAAGFDVRPILAPTVPAGEERIRVVLHSFNTPAEVRGLAALLWDVLN